MAGAADKKETEVASLNPKVERLTRQLRLMRGQRFGASSERTQVLSEQFSLFNEAEEPADSKAAGPDLEQITYRRRKQAGEREMAFSCRAARGTIFLMPGSAR